MTSFDPPSYICILGFFFFLKDQELAEIETKSSQNACEMYKLVIIWNLIKKTEKTKKYINVSKKSIFGQTYMRLAVAMETSKMMGTQLTYQNFYKG